MYLDVCVDVCVPTVYVCVLVAGDDFVVFFPRFIRGKVSFADQSEHEAPPKGSSVVSMLYGSKPL